MHTKPEDWKIWNITRRAAAYGHGRLELISFEFSYLDQPFEKLEDVPFEMGMTTDGLIEWLTDPVLLPLLVPEATTPNATVVQVAAVAKVAAGDLASEDRGIEGVYVVALPAGLGKPAMASAALDVFHASCAVGNLDDFEFFVFDQLSGEVLQADPDSAAYSKTTLGLGFSRLPDPVPERYLVRVDALGAERTVVRIADCQIVAKSKNQAGRRAIAMFWPDHVAAASCGARYRVQKI